MGDPQVTMGFITKIVIHDLDDLGVPPIVEEPFGCKFCMSPLRRYSLRVLEADGISTFNMESSYSHFKT